MPFSLVDSYRQRIFELLDSIVVRNNYKYLVVDDYTSQLIDNVLPTIDILKHNVSAVERIEERRQTRSSFEAVYILSPRPHILDCVIADFSRNPPRYGAAYLYFVPMLDENGRNKILSSPAANYVKACLPLLLDFMPIESNIFTFKDSNSLPTFYNRDCFDLVNPEIIKTARRLVSVCALLGEYPLIRFYNPKEPTHEAYTLPYMLASVFQKELDEYARANRNFPSVEENRPQSFFLILDRSIDLREPFMHEFTYEAMAHDLLFIEDGNKYTYEITDSETKDREQVVGLLNEQDLIWVALRHKYIADAMEGVHKRIVKFTEDNSSFVNIQNASASQLKDIMLSMKVFTKEKDQLSLHSNMTETISELFNRTKLADIANIEQCLATGLTEDGKPPKTVLEDMIPLLDDEHVSSRDRVRLVALYLLFRNGVIEADFRKLCLHAKLSATDMQLLRNLDLLGSPVIKASLKEKKPFKKKIRQEADDGREFTEITRYVPMVKVVLDEAVKNTLDLQTFPYTKDQSAAVFAAPENLTPQSTNSSTPVARRNKATWHDRGAYYNTPAQRIFVFLPGGITYAEVCAAYDISEAHNKEVILGSEDFLDPQNWLRNLLRLRAPRNTLDLPADKPAPEMPAFLLEPDLPPPTHIVNSSQQKQQASKNGKPPTTTSTTSSSVPSSAPHKLSRNTDHHHKSSGNPPGHFDVEKKKKSKFRLF
ncbi:Sec1-like protein [Lipomyces japonicus]|uniref:Sec1-like protein n=1 Tax=Lipomyces japonicus TaxID=56871 RepID=UPI0034CE3159